MCVARTIGPLVPMVLLTLLKVGGLDFKPTLWVHPDQSYLLHSMWPDTHGTLRRTDSMWGLQLVKVHTTLALASRPFPR